MWRAGCHAFSIIKKCETLVLESFGSVHSSQLCVHMGQINLVLNYYLLVGIHLSTVEMSGTELRMFPPLVLGGIIENQNSDFVMK